MFTTGTKDDYILNGGNLDEYGNLEEEFNHDNYGDNNGTRSLIRHITSSSGSLSSISSSNTGVSFSSDSSILASKPSYHTLQPQASSSPIIPSSNHSLVTDKVSKKSLNSSYQVDSSVVNKGNLNTSQNDTNVSRNSLIKTSVVEKRFREVYNGFTFICMLYYNAYDPRSYF